MRSIFCSLLLVVGLSGCGQYSVVPEGETPLGSSLTRDLIRKITKNVSETNTAKALYRTSVSYDGKRSSFRYSLLCAPSKMRLEMLPLNSAYALSIVIVNDGKALLLDTQEKSAQFGATAQELLKKNLGFPLGVEELCSHLLGRTSVVELEQLKNSKIAFSSAGSDVVARPRNHMMVIDAEKGFIQRMDVFSEFTGKKDLSATFTEVKSFDGVAVPTQVDFTLSSIDATVAMRLTAFSAGKALDEERFKLEVPAGYKRNANYHP